MKLSDLLSMCLRNLTRRKFRTFLTVSGVVIGTCAIVVMISLGVGISTSFSDMLQNMGDLTMIEVYTQSQEVALDDESVAMIQAMPGVVVASPTFRYEPENSFMEIVSGRKDRYSGWANLMGVYPDALEKLGYTTTEGTMEIGEGGEKHIQMLFGPEVVYNFNDTKRRWPNNYIDAYPDEDGNIPDPFFDPMEADYKVKVHPSKESAKMVEFDMKVSGILEAKERDYQMRYAIYVAMDDLKAIKAAYEKENGIKKDKTKVDSYDSVQVKVDSIENVRSVQDAIKEMGFYVSSMEEMRQTMEQSTQQIQLILGALGGVSLFVAAISITNTMIMSVYERTREIGVMKVLGCLVGNIRTVFLMEAGLIGFMGGVLGIGVSYLLSAVMNRFGGSMGESLMGIAMEGGTRISIIPPWLVLLGLIFSTLIGLVSGFYPANRAVGISALEAIKQE